MTLPVFKTGGWHLSVSSVGSTPTRFRHISMAYEAPLPFSLRCTHECGLACVGSAPGNTTWGSQKPLFRGIVQSA